MRGKIILSAVKVLSNLGVKFTVDDIKDELNISKKTIYKYFTSKEELAQSAFYYIIERSRDAQKKSVLNNSDMLKKIVFCLLEYMEIYRLQSDRIFNLYSLNLKLKADIEEKAAENFKEILEIYHEAKNDDNVKIIDDKYFKIIVEGIFEKIYHNQDRAQIGYDCLMEVMKKC